MRVSLSLLLLAVLILSSAGYAMAKASVTTGPCITGGGVFLQVDDTYATTIRCAITIICPPSGPPYKRGCKSTTGTCKAFNPHKPCEDPMVYVYLSGSLVGQGVPYSTLSGC